MKKLAKIDVDFEHPAQGRHHCAECRHFDAPEACRIVAGRVLKRDWCKRFEDKRAHQEEARTRHLGAVGAKTSEDYSRLGPGYAASRFKG
jgi:hypothetical protein